MTMSINTQVSKSVRDQGSTVLGGEMNGPARLEGDIGDEVKVLRILVPINAKEDSRWGIQYVLARHREGRKVEAILLNVGEPVTQWQVLRFRTQQEVSDFQTERAQAFIEEAIVPLTQASISCRGFFKQGDVVFSILDTAAEMECDEIAMPMPKKGLVSIFSRDIVNAVSKRGRNVTVVPVMIDGTVGSLTGH